MPGRSVFSAHVQEGFVDGQGGRQHRGQWHDLLATRLFKFNRHDAPTPADADSAYLEWRLAQSGRPADHDHGNVIRATLVSDACAERLDGSMQRERKGQWHGERYVRTRAHGHAAEEDTPGESDGRQERDLVRGAAKLLRPDLEHEAIAAKKRLGLLQSAGSPAIEGLL